MDKRYTFLKLRSCALAILAPITIFFLAQSSYAQGNCAINGDVTLLATGANKAILYWEERPCDDGTSAVSYQFSSDKMQTWSDVQTGIFYPPITVEEFDGIIIGPLRLLSSFAVQEGTTAKVLVWTSDDRGETWNGPIIVEEFSNSSFNDCPVLNGQYNHQLGRFSLVTNISSGSEANVYLLTSQDGDNW